MNRTALALILSASALLPLSTAAATVTIYQGTLSGTQEVPANASPGTGFAIVTLDDVALTMQVQSTFSGLLGNTTMAHIHCCAAVGSNAGVATQTPSFSGFPLGVQSGSQNQTYNMALASSYSAGFLTANGGNPLTAFATLSGAMAAGNTYFNIHTSQFGGGEIRGQLALAPEPSTWMMMLLGFGVVGTALRFRRRMTVAT